MNVRRMGLGRWGEADGMGRRRMGSRLQNDLADSND